MALILTVDIGKSVQIGRTIVHVDRINGNSAVRLRIDAPAEIPILRVDAKDRSGGSRKP